MIKLLICDDEPWICALISRFIDFEKLGVEPVGVAYDGETALRMIKKLRPEIVITDIKMPGKDGLELICEVRDLGLPTHFIIVSGYGTFDYARQAIRYQVEEYLVKPISREAVCEAMDKLCAAIRAENASRDGMDRAMEELEHSSKLARRYFLSNMIFNPKEIEGKTVENINAEYGMSLCEGYFQIVILNVLPLEREARASESIKKLDAYFSAVFREKCAECESYIDRESIVMLLNYDAAEADVVPKMLDYYFETVLKEPQYAGFVRMLMLRGQPMTELSGIVRSYAQARRMLALGLVGGYDRSWSFRKGMDDCGDMVCEPDEDYAERFRAVVSRQSKPALFDLIYGYIASRKGELTEHPGAFEKTLSALVRRMAELTEAGRAQTESAENRILSGYPGCGSMDELCELLSGEVFDMVEEYGRLRAGNKSLPVQHARQYIAEHFAEQITVESVADAVFLSPSYFSTLFKKELGVTFGDYLTDVRIRAAKKLLSMPEFTVAQVGELAGYADAKYFSRVFCKKVGLKPVEYRRLRAADMEAGLDE